MNKKQGVSLIVLVITIIVMIILAAAVMISLSNTGILDKANDAVDTTNLKTAQQIAALAWSEAYIDNMDETDEEIKLENITKAVNEALEKNGIPEGKYDVKITTSGVTVKLGMPADWKASVREITDDGVPIPVGFVKSPYPNEGSKDTGLVIYALKPEEIGVKTTITDEYQTALETRNQFVWVPVDSNDFKDLFVRSNFGMSPVIDETVAPEITNHAWELELNDNNMPKTTQNESYVSDTMLDEASKMYASVKKYGGFYIARYEVGTEDYEEHSDYGVIAERVSIQGNTASNLSVTMGKYPYNYVSWGTSMSDETSDNGAVSLARSFYPSEGTNPYGVVSTLTYGVQWDRTLAWWNELDSTFVVTNSTDYGIYYDTTIDEDDLNTNAKYSTGSFDGWNDAEGRESEAEYWLMTTGAYEKANVYNIYDMAGNLYEWTMEGMSYYIGYISYMRVIRGGNIYGYGADFPVASRIFVSPTSELYNYGFRPSLYIK